MPFLRAGYAEDGGSLLEKSISAGLGYQPASERYENLLGIAVNWGEPNEGTFGSGLDDQWTMEMFYRIQVTKEIVITPDVQLLIDPALNPDKDMILVMGLRARIAF